MSERFDKERNSRRPPWGGDADAAEEIKGTASALSNQYRSTPTPGTTRFLPVNFVPQGLWLA